jgi:hypothetical protein
VCHGLTQLKYDTHIAVLQKKPVLTCGPGSEFFNFKINLPSSDSNLQNSLVLVTRELHRSTKHKDRVIHTLLVSFGDMYKL